uniref:Protein-tyrosine sulfotransferase n=1 Tax=Ditylenchus dipsaci TaxID=166011 RepID=A0A915CZC5_9BILA
MSFRLRYIFCGLLVVVCLFWYLILGPVRPLNRINTHISASGGLVDVNSPFIFIGGIPRSGTTLMRAMLDAHPIVRCGEETRVIPRILALRAQWKKVKKNGKGICFNVVWLQEAGVDDNVINAAISSFIVQVIAGHGAPAERLCNKDPFTLKSTMYLAELFPRSKFVLMIRDGRATVHSIISRKVTITGFNLNDFRQCLTKWNSGIGIMYEQCNSVGPDRCMMVYYEHSVLHHEALIGKDIKLSKTERSTDQVVKPVNLDALTKWVGKIPEDVVADMASIAPMLNVLGYDPHANPPNYGKPDDIVLQKTKDVHEHGDEWYHKGVENVNDPQRVDPPHKPDAPAPVDVVEN